MTDTVRVYQTGDSGPQTWWVEADDDQTEAWSGFGRCDIVEVPAELWDAYCDAQAAETAAVKALEQATRHGGKPLP